MHHYLLDGRSSGYGIILVSESTTGVTHCAEVSSATVIEKEDAVLPEDLGKSAAQLLLDEIAKVFWHKYICHAEVLY